MMTTMSRAGFIVAVCLALALRASPEVKVVIERNVGKDATPQFKFRSVPSPSKNNAAAHAKLKIVLGQRDAGGADLSALTDGVLPADEDQPAANFFFNAGGYCRCSLFDRFPVIRHPPDHTHSPPTPRP